MNYLAHLLLSGNIEETITGNFVGDFVKGRLDNVKYREVNPYFLNGLKLHRFIDSFTDGHSTVREAKRLVALKYGRISGIIIDIYFDYFLAKHFAQYSNEPLSMFSHRMYNLIERNKSYIPEAMVPMADTMIRQNWLESYETIDGIALTFRRMSRRMGYLEPIKSAAEELRINEPIYGALFLDFFPELVRASDEFLKQLSE